MPRDGMSPNKQLLGGHAERVCRATLAAASHQRSISHWQFLESDLARGSSQHGQKSEESRLDSDRRSAVYGVGRRHDTRIGRR
jgi:hypothetical protein